MTRGGRYRYDEGKGVTSMPVTPALDGEDGRAGDAHALHGVAAHVLHGGLVDDDGVHGTLALELVLRAWEQLLRGKAREKESE